MMVLKFKRSVSIVDLDYKHILLRFENAEKFRRMWSRSLRFFINSPMRSFHWYSYFHASIALTYVPIWVYLPFFTLHLFDKEILYDIASSIVEALRVDWATTALYRLSTYRVLIDMDLSKIIPYAIWIYFSEVPRFWQPIEIKNLPKFFNRCFTVGNDAYSCNGSLKNHKSMQRKDQEDQKDVAEYAQESAGLTPAAGEIELIPAALGDEIVAVETFWGYGNGAMASGNRKLVVEKFEMVVVEAGKYATDDGNMDVNKGFEDPSFGVNEEAGSSNAGIYHKEDDHVSVEHVSMMKDLWRVYKMSVPILVEV